MSLFKETAKLYKNKMNINVLPLKGKRPTIEWDKWQTEIQTENDINNMNWDNATGLGGIQGINDWRCIDIDGAEDYEIVELILKALNLPEKYCWVVQSGSGAGFHIYIRSPHPSPLPKGEGVFEKIGGAKAVYKFKMKQEGYCKHIELRWMNCQTALPYSMHESGGIYSFYFDDPKEQPQFVELEKVIERLSQYCVIDAQRAEGKEHSVKKQIQENRKNEKVYFDKTKLESALEYLSENLPDGSYEEWYKIGFGLVPLGNEGEKYFVEMSLKNPSYNDTEFELKKKFESLIKDYDGRVTIGTIYHIAEMYGWKKPLIKFWFRENERLKISRISFKKYLESEGFCKYKIESNHLFVRIENNIVEEIDGIDVKEFVEIEKMKTIIATIKKLDTNLLSEIKHHLGERIGHRWSVKQVEQIMNLLGRPFEIIEEYK